MNPKFINIAAANGTIERKPHVKLLKNSDHRLSEPFDLKVINESINFAIKKN